MKIDWPEFPIARLAAAFVALAGSALPALAQIYVIESTAPDIKVGVPLALSDSEAMSVAPMNT